MIDDWWDPRDEGPLPWDDPVEFARMDAEMSALFAAERAELNAALTAEERFTGRYGMPALPVQPEPAHIPGDTTEDVAVFAQDRLDQIESMSRLAEAHRVTALLSAYEVSIEDLAERFGRATGAGRGWARKRSSRPPACGCSCTRSRSRTWSTPRPPCGTACR